MAFASSIAEGVSKQLELFMKSEIGYLTTYFFALSDK